MTRNTLIITLIQQNFGDYIWFKLTSEFNAYFKEYKVTRTVILIDETQTTSLEVVQRIESVAKLIYNSESEAVLFEKLASKDLSARELVVYLQTCVSLSKLYIVNNQQCKVDELIRNVKIALATKLEESWLEMTLRYTRGILVHYTRAILFNFNHRILRSLRSI
jgi:hypothetical protein